MDVLPVSWAEGVVHALAWVVIAVVACWFGYSVIR